MNETKLLYAAFVIALLTIIVLNFAVMAFVGLFKLREMESHLKNCYLLQAYREETGDGLYGRKYRLNLITAMLSKHPSLLLLNDPCAFEDIRLFPLHLRRWIEIPYRINAFSCYGFLVLFGWASILA
ncbi:hypothetical protein DJ564_05230 [Pseudomonas sp. 31-12]|uniref:hypothetical protein n=1 Tax=Pseudomonas sp. 31-12 TaxID=2201356 RepID=UPI000D6ABB71|nr:hypothetical protein [Pseudomonas sp. 31-12]AWM90254.1 hypothetical protein DJ564_05230 [Pseudomonas sp. 31-12]